MRRTFVIALCFVLGAMPAAGAQPGDDEGVWVPTLPVTPQGEIELDLFRDGCPRPPDETAIFYGAPGSWEKTTIPFYALAWEVEFLDEDFGVVSLVEMGHSSTSSCGFSATGTRYSVLKTTDRGRNFDEMIDLAAETGYPGLWVDEITFANRKVGYVGATAWGRGAPPTGAGRGRRRGRTKPRPG